MFTRCDVLGRLVPLLAAAATKPQTFFLRPTLPLLSTQCLPNRQRHCRTSGAVRKPTPRWVRSHMRELYERRLLAGPEPYRPRSAWSNWNRSAEFSALEARLGESANGRLDAQLLARVFIQPCWLMERRQEQQQLLGNSASMSLDIEEDNSKLVSQGASLIKHHLNAFLALGLPHLPSIYRHQVVDHLSSDVSLAAAGAHLGLKDLLLTANVDTINDAERDAKILACTASASRALVSCIAQSLGEKRAFAWTRDFVAAPALAEADINNFYQIFDPCATLSQILSSVNWTPPEARVLSCSAPASPLACWHVGIYAAPVATHHQQQQLHAADMRLLGRSAGETPELAEEEAAREALKALFGTEDERPPLPFAAEWHEAELALSTCSE